MPKPIPSYLRLYTERLPSPAEDEAAHGQWLEQACEPLMRLAGWQLKFEAEPPAHHDPDLVWSAPVNPGVGTALGHISIRRVCQGGATDGLAAREAAAALGELVRTLASSVLQTRRALRRREAELAACVPVIPHQDESAHLAQRLEAVLRGGAEAIGCDAAALYVLDAATTELKLRACWGLSAERLLAPPRSLAEALADLEALAGHAIAIEQPASAPAWRMPETYDAALCLPVSTPTVPLGTLWLFSRQARPFTDRDQSVAEIVAGRLAADLERHAMLLDGAGDVRWRRQLEAAGHVLHSQLPQIAPLSDSWDIAGLSDQGGPVGGVFHDWFPHRDGCLSLSLGECQGSSLAAALQAAALRGLLRGYAAHVPDAPSLVTRLNEELWHMTAGDHTASLFHGVLAEGAEVLTFVAAGMVRLYLFAEAQWQPLTACSPALGIDPSASFSVRQQPLHPGNILLAATAATFADASHDARPLTAARLEETLADYIDAPARLLAEVLRNQWSGADAAPRALLVIKRR